MRRAERGGSVDRADGLRPAWEALRGVPEGGGGERAVRPADASSCLPGPWAAMHGGADPGSGRALASWAAGRAGGRAGRRLDVDRGGDAGRGPAGVLRP